MTRLRKMMLEELQRRNYAQNTVRTYIKIVERFARHFGRSPDRLGPDQIREYQVHLFRDRHLSAGTVEQHVAALRFLYVKTLRRHYMHEHLPMPKRQRPLPDVLSLAEVQRLLDSACNLYHRAMLMTLYSTGIRRAEMCRLKVADIDSERMIVHIRKGKGGRDRDVPLSPKLLETLREYFRWMKPKTWLFPGTVDHRRADVRSPKRWHGLQPEKLRRGPGLRSASRLTFFGIPMPLTCSKPAPTCEPSRCCSDTPSWSKPSFISICRNVISKPPPIRSTR